jgi:Cu-processing system ATP-binding protein
MITLDGVSKRFGRVEALRNVSLDIRAGTVTALVGPNASGKSTLIKAILGLSRPDAGGVLLDGVPADGAGEYRRRIGYMPQAARFPENLRVADVVDLITSLRPDASRDEELIDTLSLRLDMEKTVGTLSGGTRQKLSAALAFLFRPDVLILDEPTAGLDPIASGILKEKIRRTRGEGRTVLITSHVIAELEELSDDVAFLCEGRLQFAGGLADLLLRTGHTHLEPAVAELMRAAEARARRASDPSNAPIGTAAGAMEPA